MKSQSSFFRLVLIIFSITMSTSYAVDPVNLSGTDSPGGQYLIVNPRGGLGNRLGAIASAYAMARLTKRTLVLDWQIRHGNEFGESVEMPAAFNTLFRNPVLSIEEFTHEENSKVSSDVKLQVLKLVGQKPYSIIDYINFGRFVDILEIKYKRQGNGIGDVLRQVTESGKEVIYLSTFVRDFFGPILDKECCYSKEVKQELFRYYQEFFKILEPVSIVADQVNQFESEYFPNQHSYKKVEMIGVHYRSFNTDIGETFLPYREDPYYFHREHLKSTLNKIVDGMIAKGITPRFFLATDSSEAAEYFKKNVNAEVVTFDHGNFGLTRNSIPSQLGAMIDFYLLAKTDFIVGTFQSTFSDLASVMTKTGQKINVGPPPFSLQLCLIGTTSSQFYRANLAPSCSNIAFTSMPSFQTLGIRFYDYSVANDPLPEFQQRVPTLDDLNQHFFDAIRHNDVESAKNALDNGANIDAIDESEGGATALHLATKSPSSEEFPGYIRADMIEMLIARGAEVDVVDRKEGLTPLAFAIANCRPLMVRALLAGGADPNLATTRDVRPLDLALLSLSAHGGNPPSTMIVNLLREAGAKPHPNFQDARSEQHETKAENFLGDWVESIKNYICPEELAKQALAANIVCSSYKAVGQIASCLGNQIGSFVEGQAATEPDENIKSMICAQALPAALMTTAACAYGVYRYYPSLYRQVYQKAAATCNSWRGQCE